MGSLLLTDSQIIRKTQKIRFLFRQDILKGGDIFLKVMLIISEF